jgi:uncharacterized protein (UPF0335 family)
MTTQENWEVTTERYCAFFDIMGFKDMVARNTHEEVQHKLETLKKYLSRVEKFHEEKEVINVVKVDDSKTVMFSDSIMIFTKSGSIESLNKILLDSCFIIYRALENKIPIKGALSFGKITVDFGNSFFFGQPIIDSYLLHDQLQLYTAIIDNTVEKRINLQDLYPDIKELYTNYKTPIKGGKVNHLIIRPPKINIEAEIEGLKKIYETVSGSPRIYVDNTIDFLNTLK